ncbi:DUF4279 domain-containing protein [Neorhizobium sp. T786]|uniref:DUF4279 domain-containing protein n=1 Tax=Pseudorhizobium xiangyangii TaxID=2883104 RepID=UPI001CFF8C5F|nr:DUF4279 domain-containing protein [Neorhizobium xiangyangii]MCB5205401.1 DUF4279 domain-containing protein [Neorhizobium xiangyangii]
MERKLWIDLCLEGNLTPPKEITRILNVTPDKEMLRGERDGSKDLPRSNLWSIYSTGSSDEVEDHWKSIFGKIEHVWDKFEEISKSGEVMITIIVDATGRIPSVMIPPQMAAAAAKLNAYIDIDYYQ